MARWRGRGGRGGACRHSEGSRGRRWPRRYGGTAAAALGLERERERKRGRVRERVRERSGLRGVVRGVPGRRGGSQAGREELARLACAPGTQLLRGEGRKTTEGLQWWAGPASCSAGPVGLPGERQVRCSVLYFCFSIYLLCFDLVYKPNHFNKS